MAPNLEGKTGKRDSILTWFGKKTTWPGRPIDLACHNQPRVRRPRLWGRSGSRPVTRIRSGSLRWSLNDKIKLHIIEREFQWQCEVASHWEEVSLGLGPNQRTTPASLTSLRSRSRVPSSFSPHCGRSRAGRKAKTETEIMRWKYLWETMRWKYITCMITWRSWRICWRWGLFFIHSSRAPRAWSN